jgi:1-acyl-sn-glycerol-3-phosphate acyltransferase
MNALRAAAFYAALVGWTVVMGIFGAPTLILPRATLARFSRLWAKGTIEILAATVGIRHRVIGEVPRGPIIVAARHQSAWETLALPTILDDPSIVLKRELTWIPIFGWYLARNRMVPIDRKGGGSALRRMVRAARAAVAHGRPILVFPEGTRTPSGVRRDYHPGVYALYRDLGLPVVPVALNSGLFWPRRSFAKTPGTVTVQFLPAIAPRLSRDEFMAELKDRIDTATEKLTTETQRHRGN